MAMVEAMLRHRHFSRTEIRHWQKAGAEEGLRVGFLLIQTAKAINPEGFRRVHEWKRKRARRS